VLEIAPEALAKLAEHALREAPREIVGVLITDLATTRIIDYEPRPNTTHDDPETTFKIDDYWDRGIRRDRAIPVHSHPQSEPVPSWEDCAGASREWYGRPYAIYGVRERELRIFTLGLRPGWCGLIGTYRLSP
jgi:proteasome lid subunit RPN8/RPN11